MMSQSTIPAAPPRGPGRWIAAAVFAVVLASFVSLDLHWADWLAPQALGRIAAFIASFWPPEHAPAYLAQLGRASLETLAMSALGTGLAALGGLLLALPASRHGGLLGAVLRSAARLVLNALRAVPELVWATLLLVAAGLGPFPGTLALALHTTGVLGRLFAEAIENAPSGSADALRRHGVGALPVFCWATWPQIVPQLLSYTLYRWENNIRAAAVLGVVGAGGLGQMLSYHLGLFHTRESGSVLLAMMGLVALVDALSFGLRRVLNR
jgi:phosphonate transport system permease protein